MSEGAEIVEVAELDFVVESASWTFAEKHAARIAAHWAEARRAKPELYNGRVLLLNRRTLAGAGSKLKGAFFETSYENFIAWRAFGHPGEPVASCFSMAALRSADGAFLLGEMAPHTYNGGLIYFPAGTPDPSDVFGGRLDLDASARRELFEETGVSAGEAAIKDGWTVVFTPQRIACMKLMTLSLSAEKAKARIEAFLALDPHSELTRMHVVRRAADIDEARTPPHVSAYLRLALA